RGGPGETQIEVDRRMTRARIQLLQNDLKRIISERATQSHRRRQAFRVALVGYTNAGKSTLLNALTGARVYVEDRLFATLDTTTRKLTLSDGHMILLSDTVGFIRKLPHHLIASFRSTLAEVAQSHHERWDGTGYPRGLAGRDVSLIARVVGIVDKYVALISERPHRPAFLVEEALQVIEDSIDLGAFEPALARQFPDTLTACPIGMRGQMKDGTCVRVIGVSPILTEAGLPPWRSRRLRAVQAFRIPRSAR
ncbi:MAG: 50S ribosome-binding GTPase, partial [Planctomycetes bacterium]|nr:50S ribosome-binding GTPase [Planctomycetota bacterium]